MSTPGTQEAPPDGADPSPLAGPAGPARGTLKSEFKIHRDGKDFALYAGLLDLGHQEGLRSIVTTLVQCPTELNGMVAIVSATVETRRGLFMGLGDASPGNVTRMMAPHLIRMAETRAKARALRDAVNVGVAALEELGPSGAEGQGEEEEPDDAPSGRRAPVTVRGPDPAGPATQQQLDAIARLSGAARVQVATDGLTFGQAAEQITQLQRLQPKRGGEG
jgi:hypothetical protein